MPICRDNSRTNRTAENGLLCWKAGSRGFKQG